MAIYPEVTVRWSVVGGGIRESNVPREEIFEIFNFALNQEQMKQIHQLARRAGERTIDRDYAPTWER